MVFKRPGNSRDDKSNQSPNRRKAGDERAPKTGASRYSKSSTSGFGKAGDKPERNNYGERTGDAQKSFSSTRRKAHPGRTETGDGSSHRFTGENTASRNRSGERPQRSTDSKRSDGERTYSPKVKAPYSGRPAANDRPKRSFSGEAANGKPKRGFGGESANEKPKRSFNDEQKGERKFGGKPGFKSNDRPAGRKPGTGRSSEDPGYKPFRKSANSSYNNKPSFKSERSTEDRPLRSRKKSTEDSGLIRLNRYISNAGICSRRKADELISAGVISVNGEVVSELGYKIDPAKDSVRYNGELLKREKMVYVLLNKPKDYITTTDDPQERRTVMHLVEKASRERIYPIGRLDRNTTGLLLMTNDGDLADKLSHPKNNIVKLYHVELNKNLTQGDLNKIGFGLELEDGFIQPDSVSYVQGGTKREIGIQIHSGKNRIVRRIFEHLGYEVVKLDRAVYANLTKKDLPRGRWRYLDEKEVIQLKHLI